MKTTLLFVDDEESLLVFYRNVFAAESEVVTATSAAEAFDILRQDDSFSVVTTDLNMPEIDGLDFLKKLKELSPHSVRMMLTGYANKDTAIAAVNEADVFKLLTKPISLSELKKAIRDAERKFEIDRAERVLLENTVNGSVSILVEVLAMANPVVFGRATERRRIATRICQALGFADTWEAETAALLGNIGMLSLPQDVMSRITQGAPLEGDMAHIHNQVDVGANLVRQVPRLDGVAEAIALQYKNFDGSGYPEHQRIHGTEIPLGARILRIINEQQMLLSQGHESAQVLEMLSANTSHFDGKVLAALETVNEEDEEHQTITNVSLDVLPEGAELAHDIYNIDDVLLVRAGVIVSDYLLQRLRNFAHEGLIPDNAFVRRQSASS
jgi:response regulator RpfG family c-di-GMP phosphodiesterase